LKEEFSYSDTSCQCEGMNAECAKIAEIILLRKIELALKKI